VLPEGVRTPVITGIHLDDVVAGVSGNYVGERGLAEAGRARDQADLDLGPVVLVQLEDLVLEVGLVLVEDALALLGGGHVELARGEGRLRVAVQLLVEDDVVPGLHPG